MKIFFIFVFISSCFIGYCQNNCDTIYGIIPVPTTLQYSETEIDSLKWDIVTHGVDSSFYHCQMAIFLKSGGSPTIMYKEFFQYTLIMAFVYEQPFACHYLYTILKNYREEIGEDLTDGELKLCIRSLTICSAKGSKECEELKEKLSQQLLERRLNKTDESTNDKLEIIPQNNKDTIIITPMTPQYSEEEMDSRKWNIINNGDLSDFLEYHLAIWSKAKGKSSGEYHGFFQYALIATFVHELPVASHYVYRILRDYREERGEKFTDEELQLCIRGFAISIAKGRKEYEELKEELSQQLLERRLDKMEK